MPCLNEAQTIGICIRKALDSFERIGIAGEVVVADNGSTDGSQQIAEELGARVVPVEQRGYGAALDRRDRSRTRPLGDHGRRRRQLRLLEARAVRRAAS